MLLNGKSINMQVTNYGFTTSSTPQNTKAVLIVSIANPLELSAQICKMCNINCLHGGHLLLIYCLLKMLSLVNHGDQAVNPSSNDSSGCFPATQHQGPSWRFRARHFIMLFVWCCSLFSSFHRVKSHNHGCT